MEAELLRLEDDQETLRAILAMLDEEEASDMGSLLGDELFPSTASSSSPSTDEERSLEVRIRIPPALKMVVGETESPPQRIPRNRRWHYQKAEMQSLRDQVVQLEQVLTHLKNKQQSIVRNDDVSGNLWRAIAKRQQQQRHAAELENMKLKEEMERHSKIAKRTEGVLHKWSQRLQVLEDEEAHAPLSEPPMITSHAFGMEADLARQMQGMSLQNERATPSSVFESKTSSPQSDLMVLKDRVASIWSRLQAPAMQQPTSKSRASKSSALDLGISLTSQMEDASVSMMMSSSSDSTSIPTLEISAFQRPFAAPASLLRLFGRAATTSE
ncbi:hypothetical protein Poli38472_004899 [Pythium oligandrum]|uniref:Uncharacterized protein n=1 Tax=Pythium oligandrum TaxID=41045 RepID=A0A8K1CB24_PYTOL|nr:hypothetical protein Poli38472_004899 [Pythium oligandrum]|eukprot:TMW59830.1 hypothetical protein Poli38472_004899 [Pythium oligandrum]